MSGFVINDPDSYRMPAGYCDHVTRWLETSGVIHIAGDFWQFRNVVWTIFDNGGELCIGRVNISYADGFTYRKVAYSGCKPTPTPCTLFCWIWKVLNDDPIDYEHRAEAPGEPWTDPPVPGSGGIRISHVGMTAHEA